MDTMIGNSYLSFCDKMQNGVTRTDGTDKPWRISSMCGCWTRWLEGGKRCSIAARGVLRKPDEKRNPEEAEMRKKRKRKKAVKHKKKV